MFVKQEETRTRYQQQIAAELQEKARQKAAEAERPDGVEDSAFLRATKRTTSLAGIWIAIFIAIILLAVFFILKSIKVL